MSKKTPAEQAPSNSEALLASAHGGPAIPLTDVCEKYFGLTYYEAVRRAALNQLGLPTFRLRDSQKAPVMVRAKELADYLDRTADRAAEQWQKSQL